MDELEHLSLHDVSVVSPIATEHVHRYELAREVFERAGVSRVLDLGCGSGYGATMLAEAGFEVVAIDNNATAIDEARRSLAGFTDCDVQDAEAVDHLESVSLDEYDAIVAIEVLEHLDHLESAASRLAEFAASGRTLVVSVPNSKYYGEKNEFHATDFDLRAAKALFDQIGEHDFIEQHPAEGSMMLGTEVEHPADERVVLVGNAEENAAHHFIGVFNCPGFAHTVSARMAFLAAPQHSRYMRVLEVANRRLWHENARLGRELIYTDSDRSTKRGSAAASELRRNEADAIKYRDDEVTALYEALEATHSSFSWRITRPLRAIKGAARRSGA